MDASDVLLGIAETAVGVAGFAGVSAAVMLNRSIQRDDQFRFICLFASSLSVVFLAFVPILLEMSGMADARLWTWSSALFLGVTCVALPLAAFTSRLAIQQKNLAPPWALGILWFFTIAAPTTQVLNLVGQPGAVLFIAGLLSWLGAAGVLFVIIVLVRQRQL
jgi:hypothetical protein